ncbi:M28 family metallopeptidase [Actinoplanes sp. NPDC000266]
MSTPTVARDGLDPLLAEVGGAAARSWLGQTLADLGAAVRFDGFTVPSVPEVYAAPVADWHDGATPRRLEFGRDLALHMASAEQPLVQRGETALVGAGDQGGRWLLVPEPMSLFEAYGRAGGALGLLISRAVDGDGWHYTMLAGSAPGPRPVLVLAPDIHDAMPRGGGSLAATAPIRRLDASAGNVHARWGGATPEILLTAHYDGVGDLPGLRQPSAADNASGVAVVMEAARILAPVLPGLAVALLDAEEAGALGSARHAGRLRADRAAPLVINVDGAGVRREAAAVEAGGPAHRLLAALDQAGRHTGLPLAAGPVASDNRRYAAAGLAAVGVGAGMGGYHSPSDTPDRVEAATLQAVAKLVVATAWLAAIGSCE